MSSLSDYTSRAFVRTLSSVNKFQAIDELARVYEGTDICSNVDVLVKSLKEREELMSTGIGFGIAIPHAKIPDIVTLSFAIGISKTGINFDSMDGSPVHLLILVVAGEKQHREYLGLLSNIMSMLKKNEVKEQIIASTSPDEVLSLLHEYSLK
jgi:mannitol/fructose-specific phosphotransferase system IIA component (Ntr-type)